MSSTVSRYGKEPLCGTLSWALCRLVLSFWLCYVDSSLCLTEGAVIHEVSSWFGTFIVWHTKAGKASRIENTVDESIVVTSGGARYEALCTLFDNIKCFVILFRRVPTKIWNILKCPVAKGERNENGKLGVEVSASGFGHDKPRRRSDVFYVNDIHAVVFPNDTLDDLCHGLSICRVFNIVKVANRCKRVMQASPNLWFPSATVGTYVGLFFSIYTIPRPF